VRVAFDDRLAADVRGAGGYSQWLLRALRDTADEGDEVRETRRPRAADDLFHAPWLQGAPLHPPCPTVVTVHDLEALRHPRERLRCGGMHLRLRHLAVQRAAHVIVPSEAVAREAVAELGLEHERMTAIPYALDPEAPAPASSSAAAGWTWEDVARVTWRVYRWALAHPHRPCVTAWRPARSRGGRHVARA
jgi:hypothetical protein